MSQFVELRILGYAVTVMGHATNLMYMDWLHKNHPSDNENVKQFKSLESRFFTTWTVFLQMCYAMYGLAIDLFILKHAVIKGQKDYRLPPSISGFREFLFAAVVWPSSLVVFTVFWGVYSFDRTLIFPEFLDAVIPPISNHIIHTLILPVALWELVTLPRKEPERHAQNVSQLSLHIGAYLSVLCFTYFERGVWLYPIFRKLFGTVYFFIVLAAIGSLFYIFYYLQWPLTNWIHGSKKKSEKKKNKSEKKKVK
ncbi:hypothetical protein PYW08_011258 [Mythimna loreyi]|uniref:Uncharacterized protein n=1 Tax=Mythimna loreyi TaxID=667449 RepID=A0ACC2Q595_9NEOP|nr:hypothetical protein PYW08_011258 [Mythimna loreyi]